MKTKRKYSHHGCIAAQRLLSLIERQRATRQQPSFWPQWNGCVVSDPYETTDQEAGRQIALRLYSLSDHPRATASSSGVMPDAGSLTSGETSVANAPVTPPDADAHDAAT